MVKYSLVLTLTATPKKFKSKVCAFNSKLSYATSKSRKLQNKLVLKTLKYKNLKCRRFAHLAIHIEYIDADLSK